MSRKTLLQICIVLFCIHKGFGQTMPNLDSLKAVNDTISSQKEKLDNLARLFNAYLYNDPARAFQYALDEVRIAQSVNYQEGVGMGYYHLGVYHNNTDNADSARHYYLLAKDQFQDIGRVDRVLTVNHGLAIVEYGLGNYDDAIEILQSNVGINLEKQYDSLVFEKELNLAIAYDLIGQIHLFKGNHNIALEETLKAMDILKDLDKPIRQADALNHLASIEFYLNNFNKSIKYNLEALVIYRKYNDKFYESQVLNDLGNVYYYLDEYDSAIHYLESALPLTLEIGSKDLEGTVLNNLGKVYSIQGQYAKSITYSKKALAIHEHAGSQNKVVESLNNLGMVHNQLGQYAIARNYFDPAIELASDLGMKENIRIGYFNRSIAFERSGNYQRALEDYKAYKTTEDSIFSETKSRQIEEMRTIYEIENKEREIALQKNEIQLLEEKDKVKSLQLTGLTSGILLMISIFGLIYIVMYQKMKRRQLEKEVVDRELAYKRKELTTHALHLANKNEILEGLKEQIDELKNEGQNIVAFNKISNTIKFNLQDDKNWENFSKYFEQVHKDFNAHIKKKYPEVTSNELRLMALLKMNLSSKEIANILNISGEGIKKARYRLRKKMNINNDDSLQDLILGL